jgi:hypothetical protein
MSPVATGQELVATRVVALSIQNAPRCTIAKLCVYIYNCIILYLGYQIILSTRTSHPHTLHAPPRPAPRTRPVLSFFVFFRTAHIRFTCSSSLFLPGSFASAAHTHTHLVTGDSSPQPPPNPAARRRPLAAVLGHIRPEPSPPSSFPPSAQAPVLPLLQVLPCHEGESIILFCR